MHKDQEYSSGKTVFSVGAISLVFLVIGYETALFVHRAASLRIQEKRDSPDTVYVISEELASRLLASDGGKDTSMRTYPKRTEGFITVRKDAPHPEAVARERAKGRKVESFRFNPNSASAADLVRLGMSEKQAQSIVNYREKGGRFARKSDFAKSFVVSDSLYKRLEPYIDIPLVDINLADSAAFDALPGIGGYFSSKMVSYREELGGYSCPEQLMEIWRFDRERYDRIKDLICCSPPRNPLPLWSGDEATLAAHPHIRNRNTARAIILFRKHTPPDRWSVQALYESGIIDSLAMAKLSRCTLAQP